MTGFVDGDCPWDLDLGQLIGDGKFDGESFGVGCGWVFKDLVGQGGQEKTLGHVQQGRFSLDDTCFQTDPFFMLYIIYCSNSGGFSVSYFRPLAYRTVSPILDTLDRHVHC